MTAAALHIPRSLAEAVAVLDAYGSDLVIMGGGTIVMEKVNEGRLFPRRVVSLKRAGIDVVETANGHVDIGATVTPGRLDRLDSVPMLAEAAGMLGGPAVRTMATVGGNLFAPAPYGDLGVPLLALDAQVELVGPGGRRTLALDAFFAARDEIARGGREIVSALRVPRARGRTAYLKFGRRQANTPAVVAVAVNLTIGDDGVCRDARIALGAAAPYPLRPRGAEATLGGRPVDAENIADAAAAAMKECDPPTDALASAWYRRKMVGVFVRRALERAAGHQSPDQGA